MINKIKLISLVLVLASAWLVIGANGCPWTKDTTVGEILSGSSGELHTPTNLIAYPALSGIIGIDLEWSGNSGNETGFKIERSPDGINFTEVLDHSNPIANTPYTPNPYCSDINLTPYTTYYYRVKAYDSLGRNTDYSNIISATTGSIVSFGDVSLHPVSGQAYAMGDFNNDGKLDLVTGADHTHDNDSDPEQLSIHFGNGDGTFQARIDYNTGNNIIGIVCADVDNDSDIDIITFCGEQFTEEGKIYVHLNNGSGVFNAPISRTVSSGMTSWEQGLLAADLNNDNKIDIITYSEHSGTTDICRISVLLGNGNGIFQDAVNYDIPEGVTSVHAADLDNDNDIDLVTTHRNMGGYGVNKVAIWLNNGNGTFTTAVQYDPDHANILNAAIADINSDNKPDVITVSYGGIGVYLGNGDGTLVSPTYYSTVNGADSIIIEDFNGDSKLDFIIDSAGTGFPGIFIHLGNGDGTIAAGIKYTSGCISKLQRFDINNDGKLDFICMDYNAAIAGGGTTAFVAILLGK